MQEILLGFQVLLALSIIILVLLQQGKGADAGASFGGGSSGSLFGSRGPASFLARSTGLLAAVFFANSIGLAYLATERVRAVSVIEQLESAPEGALPAHSNDVPMAPGSSQPVGSDMPTAPSGASGDQNKE
ncbi:MAG: preprotein translocase subunit SecG [Gammaproteobacteria bacterium]|jgi:preprotein translocase subunit SecG